MNQRLGHGETKAGDVEYPDHDARHGADFEEPLFHMSLFENRAEARGGLFFIGYEDFSGNGGAMGSMSLSAALEAQALSNSLAGAPDMMRELEAMYNDVCVALASELQDTC